MTGALMSGNVRNYGGWNVSIMPLNIPTHALSELTNVLYLLALVILTLDLIG